MTDDVTGLSSRNNKRIKEEIASRSGLTPAIVETLLHAGYSYVEHVAEPARWVRDGLFEKLKD